MAIDAEHSRAYAVLVACRAAMIAKYCIRSGPALDRAKMLSVKNNNAGTRARVIEFKSATD